MLFLLLFMRWLFNHDCVQDLRLQILVAKQYSSSDTQIMAAPFTNNLLFTQPHLLFHTCMFSFFSSVTLLTAF